MVTAQAKNTYISVRLVFFVYFFSVFSEFSVLVFAPHQTLFLWQGIVCVTFSFMAEMHGDIEGGHMHSAESRKLSEEQTSGHSWRRDGNYYKLKRAGFLGDHINHPLSTHLSYMRINAPVVLCCLPVIVIKNISLPVSHPHYQCLQLMSWIPKTTMPCDCKYIILGQSMTEKTIADSVRHEEHPQTSSFVRGHLSTILQTKGQRAPRLSTIFSSLYLSLSSFSSFFFYLALSYIYILSFLWM